MKMIKPLFDENKIKSLSKWISRQKENYPDKNDIRNFIRQQCFG